MHTPVPLTQSCVRNIGVCCPGCLGQDVPPAGSRRRSEQQQEYISVSAFTCYTKTGKKRPSNNICWQRRAETITENTFRQIDNMRSKVTAESEGINITATWLIATVLITGLHRQSKQSEAEERWWGERKKSKYFSQVRVLSICRCEMKSAPGPRTLTGNHSPAAQCGDLFVKQVMTKRKKEKSTIMSICMRETGQVTWNCSKIRSSELLSQLQAMKIKENKIKR